MCVYLRMLIGIAIISSLSANLNAASISGTILHSDMTTPITTNGFKILVEAYSEQCPTYNCDGWCAQLPPPSAWVNSDTGTYIIRDLQPGNYYLIANVDYYENYLSEWWANPTSVRQCEDATEITVLSEYEEKTGSDFYLDAGGTISGTVFKNDGVTPVTGAKVEAFSDIDPFVSAHHGYIDGNGNYTIVALTPGQYYVQATPTRPLGHQSIAFTREWWAGQQSSEDIPDAQVIVVHEGEPISDKNFQLDPRLKILGTIFFDDSVTIGEKKIKVLISKTPCGEEIDYNNNQFDALDNDYLVWGIPPGTYYLRAEPYGITRFAVTWWNSSGSVSRCSSAQQIVVGEESNLFDINLEMLFPQPFPWEIFLPALTQKKHM